MRTKKPDTHQELAAAEYDAQELADYFDLDRALNRMMNSEKYYSSRELAFEEWFTEQLRGEVANCCAVDPTMLEVAEIHLRRRVDEQTYNQFKPLLALPAEIRLVKLYRLLGARKRVADLRKALKRAA